MGTYSNVTYVIKMFLFPILVFGFVTNTISFIVMKRIKSSSTAKYMSILALIDCGVLLVGGFSLWAHSINYYSSKFISIIGCKLIPFLFYSLADYSVIIIVLMTGERFYGVWKPFHANKMSKKRMFRLNLLVGFLFCCLINSHFLITHNLVKFNETPLNLKTGGMLVDSVIIHSSNEFKDMSKSASTNYVCEYTMWKDFYERYWVFIDASIYSFIPSFLIVTFNIIIIRLLNKADKINSNLNHRTTRTESIISNYNTNLLENEIKDCVELAKKKVEYMNEYEKGENNKRFQVRSNSIQSLNRSRNFKQRHNDLHNNRYYMVRFCLSRSMIISNFRIFLYAVK